MRSRIVLTQNVAALNDAGEALMRRAPGMPGMGLVHGEPGYGKTTAITWHANRVNAVYVRAMATWTPAAMLRTLCKELGFLPRGSCALMIEDIIESLALSARPLYVDELNNVVGNKKLVETMRDIHDMAGVPVVLVGSVGIDRELAHMKQLTRRIMQDVRFRPLDFSDTEKLATSLCEVSLSEDLLKHLHHDARGSAGLVTVGLERLEKLAKGLGSDRIDLATWKKQKKDLFTGDAPDAGDDK